jgi:hypothetical protein
MRTNPTQLVVAGEITAGDSLAIKEAGSVGVSFTTDVIHSQYNFEEVTFLTAP